MYQILIWQTLKLLITHLSNSCRPVSKNGIPRFVTHFTFIGMIIMDKKNQSRNKMADGGLDKFGAII